MEDCEICGAKFPERQLTSQSQTDKITHYLIHIIERLENIEELLGFEGAKSRIKAKEGK